MPPHKDKPPRGAENPDPQALQDENLRLKRAVEELSILNDLARSISAARSTEDVIGKVVRRAMRAINAEQAVVTLVDRQRLGKDGAGGGAPADAKTFVRAMSSSVDREQFHLHQNLLGWMYLHKAPLLANDVSREPALRGVPLNQGLVSLLCVPLVVKSELTGVLTACNKRGGAGFTEDDQRLLAIIAAQSAQMIENARLREEEQTLLAMREQLRLARQIQLGLLPKEPPAIPGYDLAGVSIPAQEIGGDYFDFIPLTGGQLAICLGDVSGKGLPASLLMSNLQATLRGQSQLNARAEECITWSNRLLYRSTDPEKFATLFFAVLDPRIHTLEYCNAGHERPLLLRCGGESAGKPTRLARGGLVLGVLEDFAYDAETLSLELGDLLVIYSDGATDACNEADEAFGEQRLLDLACRLRERPSAEILTVITGAIKAHAGRAPQTDNVTLVVVKRTE